MPVARLKHLHSDEVSLVPKAANRRVFLLRKGDRMAFDEVKALQTLEKLDAAGQGELIEALAGADDADLVAVLEKATSMSEDEKTRLKAAGRILGKKLAAQYLASAGKAAKPDDEEEDDDDEAEDEDDETPAQRSEKRKKGKGLSAQQNMGPHEGEDSFEGKKRKMKKSATVELPADVKAQLAKAAENETRLEKAERALADMQTAKERDGYIRKAATIASALPGASADDLGTILHKTSKALTADEQKRLESVLAGANTLVKSAAFAELGSSRPGEEGDAYKEVQAEAEKLVKADNSGRLTIEQARARVMKAHPELLKRITKAHDERVRNHGRG